VRLRAVVLGAMVTASGCGAAPGPVAAVESRDAPERPVPLRDTSGGLVTPREAREMEAEQAAAKPPSRQEEGPDALHPLLAPWRLGGSPSVPAGHGRLIDLDVRDADIEDVCRLLADVGRVNIVVADDVHGKVTVVMKRVPWDQALEVIAQAKGLRAVREGDIILVKPAGR
jgi:hypothetical protein